MLVLLGDPEAGADPDPAEVGAKAASLIRMTAAGLPVPAGAVLPVALFAPWIEEIRASATWARLTTASPADWPRLCHELKQLAAGLSWSDAQRRALSALRGTLAASEPRATFAVRSSSPEEDLATAAFAGAYETLLGVRPDGLEEAVRSCFASCLDARVLTYKRQRGLELWSPRIAVVVQRQLDAEVAGVAFSIDPATNDYDEASIDASWGLGTSVVEGRVSPDHFVVDKLEGRVVEASVGDKRVSAWVSPEGGTFERQGHRAERAHARRRSAQRADPASQPGRGALRTAGGRGVGAVGRSALRVTGAADHDLGAPAPRDADPPRRAPAPLRRRGSVEGPDDERAHLAAGARHDGRPVHHDHGAAARSSEARRGSAGRRVPVCRWPDVRQPLAAAVAVEPQGDGATERADRRADRVDHGRCRPQALPQPPASAVDGPAAAMARSRGVLANAAVPLEHPAARAGAGAGAPRLPAPRRGLRKGVVRRKRRWCVGRGVPAHGFRAPGAGAVRRADAHAPGRNAAAGSRRRQQGRRARPRREAAARDRGQRGRGDGDRAVPDGAVAGSGRLRRPVSAGRAAREARAVGRVPRRLGQLPLQVRLAGPAGDGPGAAALRRRPATGSRADVVHGHGRRERRPRGRPAAPGGRAAPGLRRAAAPRGPPAPGPAAEGLPAHRPVRRDAGHAQAPDAALHRRGEAAGTGRGPAAHRSRKARRPRARLRPALRRPARGRRGPDTGPAAAPRRADPFQQAARGVGPLVPPRHRLPWPHPAAPARRPDSGPAARHGGVAGVGHRRWSPTPPIPAGRRSSSTPPPSSWRWGAFSSTAP